MHHRGELALFLVLKISKETGGLSLPLWLFCSGNLLHNDLSCLPVLCTRAAAIPSVFVRWLAKKRTTGPFGDFHSIFSALDFITKRTFGKIRLLSNKIAAEFLDFEFKCCVLAVPALSCFNSLHI
jgi:hypothetical protein